MSLATAPTNLLFYMFQRFRSSAATEKKHVLQLMVVATCMELGGNAMTNAVASVQPTVSFIPLVLVEKIPVSSICRHSTAASTRQAHTTQQSYRSSCCDAMCLARSPLVERHFLQCETVTTLPEVSRRRGLCGQGALIVANADFVCYGIKSNIRVIHRPSGVRALIKLPAGSGKATPQVRRCA